MVGSLACGDDDGSSAADAGPDVDADVTPSPDAAVTAQSCGVDLNYPLALDNVGVLVAFNRADGSFIETQVTDVDGKASSSACEPGTTITMQRPQFFSAPTIWNGMYSVAGVEPGDTVTFPRPLPEPLPNTFVEVTVPEATAFAAAYYYSVSIGCGATGAYSSLPTATTANVQVYNRSCLGSDQTVDLFAILRDSSFNVIATSSVTGVAVTEGATVPTTLPAWSAGTLGSLDINLHSPAPMAQGGSVSLNEGRDSFSFSGYAAGYTLDEDGLATVTAQVLPTGFVDFRDVQVITSFLAGPGSPISSVKSYVRAAPVAPVDVDLAATHLPRLAGVVFTNVEAPKVSWFADGSLADVDGGSMRGFVNSDVYNGEWTVVFPGTMGTEFVFPSLPESFGLSSFDLTLTKASFFDFDWVDYQGILNAGFDPYSFLDSYIGTADSTAVGRVGRFTSWTSPPI